MDYALFLYKDLNVE